MDRPTSSLMHFDSFILDVNKNPSDVDSVVANGTADLQTEASKVKGSTISDSLFYTTCQTISETELKDSTISDSLFYTTCQSISEPELKDTGFSGLEGTVFSRSRNSDENAPQPELNDESDACSENKAPHGQRETIDEMLDITATNLNLSNTPDAFSSELPHNATFNCSNEEFRDAVQFFKDPTNISFLENCGKPASNEAFCPRSSLYMNFDPLASKYSQPEEKALEKITEADSFQDGTEDGLSAESSNPFTNQDDAKPVLRKFPARVNDSPRRSLGNILIRFDSPVVNAVADDKQGGDVASESSPKLYSEEDLQHALKIKELSMEENFIKKQKELEDRIAQQNALCASYFSVLKEVLEVTYSLSEKEKNHRESVEKVAEENKKLKEDLEASNKDLQSVETTFADFHKRYEQCKGMLKVFTQNENTLKQQMENMSQQLKEKEEMYAALQAKTEEMVDKANLEVANVKKSNDVQSAVLKAQLKKAELKISSLENELTHVKIENEKLSSICDDLMAKVSGT